jgi:hypothetical protein
MTTMLRSGAFFAYLMAIVLTIATVPLPSTAAQDPDSAALTVSAYA